MSLWSFDKKKTEEYLGCVINPEKRKEIEAKNEENKKVAYKHLSEKMMEFQNELKTEKDPEKVEKLNNKLSSYTTAIEEIK